MSRVSDQPPSCATFPRTFDLRLQTTVNVGSCDNHQTTLVIEYPPTERHLIALHLQFVRLLSRVITYRLTSLASICSPLLHAYTHLHRL